MRLLTFVLQGSDNKTASIGALKDDNTVLDLQKAYQAKYNGAAAYFNDMISFLDSFAEAKKMAEQLLTEGCNDAEYKLAEVKLLAPVPRPRSIRDCSTFSGHLTNIAIVRRMRAGMKREDINIEECKPAKMWYKYPPYYMGNTNSVVGPDSKITYPVGETLRDYELEIGCYIGKAGKMITEERALDHVAGFTIFNDCSARAFQFEETSGRHLGPCRGKHFDTGNVMGPYLVTADEFNIQKASGTVKVNGEVWGECNTRDSYVSLEYLIAYLSKDMTLYPGDFIGLGTLTNGTALEHNRVLNDGDVVEMEITGLGRLVTTVAKS